MNTKKKKVLFALGGVAVVLVLAVIVFVLTFDINSYRSRIEVAASRATGLQVRIIGKMGLSLFPFGMSAKDVHVASNSGDIISVESLKLGTELMPLLKNELKVTSCELVKPVVTIVKDTAGKYNFEGTGKKSTVRGPGEAISLNKFKLSEGVLIYLDDKTGDKTEFKAFNLAIDGLSIGDTAADIVKNVSFTGKIDCKEVLLKDYKISDLQATVKSVKGIYDFEPLTIGDLVVSDSKTREKTEMKTINLAIKNLSLGDTSGDIVKNVSFNGTFGCKQVLLNGYQISDLQATVKSVKGIYNFEPLTIGDLVLSDSKTGEKTELKIINLAIKGLSIGDTSGDIIKNISFTGSMDCKELRKKDLTIDNVRSPVRVAQGVIYLTLLTMDIFGSQCEGDATIDESAVAAVYKINFEITNLEFSKLEESFGTKKVIGGKGDLSASLTITEKGNRNLMGSMDGTVSLRGDNLTIYTMDLDKVLSSLATSQQFNLVDLGAFFIAGPLSSVALKGYRYGDVYNQTRGGQGIITQFISHWKIRGGVADATDCALATRHNRVALKGKLNLLSEQYDGVIVALLDDKGCATFKQSINGPFGSPKVSAVSAGESLAAPIVNLFRQVEHFVQGGKCEVFYKGSVKQPPK
jgi:hypothetical protein